MDLDGDADMDALSAQYDANTIAWHENNGAETFTQYALVSGNAGGAQYVQSIDIDGDNDLDVLAAYYSDQTIALWSNDGSQAFTESDVATSISQAMAATAADLDEDGDVDVAFAGNDAVSWVANDCGVYIPPTPRPTPSPVRTPRKDVLHESPRPRGVRGDESRRRRGCRAESPRGRRAGAREERSTDSVRARVELRRGCRVWRVRGDDERALERRGRQIASELG